MGDKELTQVQKNERVASTISIPRKQRSTSVLNIPRPTSPPKANTDQLQRRPQHKRSTSEKDHPLSEQTRTSHINSNVVTILELHEFHTLVGEKISKLNQKIKEKLQAQDDKIDAFVTQTTRDNERKIKDLEARINNLRLRKNDYKKTVVQQEKLITSYKIKLMKSSVNTSAIANDAASEILKVMHDTPQSKKKKSNFDAQEMAKQVLVIAVKKVLDNIKLGFEPPT